MLERLQKQVTTVRMIKLQLKRASLVVRLLNDFLVESPSSWRRRKGMRQAILRYW